MRRFGKFEFDPVSRRLSREGVDIHLPPKVFELLAALLDAAPAVVSKRELHARLWPNGFVADATLVALVKQLRAALGDRDRKTRLVRTVHRMGYALEIPAGKRERPATTAAARWLLLGERRLSLVNGENIVGRDVAANVRLDHPVVSRRHARILVSGAAALLEDLGSKNRTFIEGEPLSGGPVPLRDGNQLAFGTVLVTYRESGTGMPTLTQLGPPDS